MQTERTKKSAWIHALRIWNKEKGGKYVVPKKGTKEHAEVKAIMDKGLQEGGFLGSLLGGLASVVLPGLLGGNGIEGGAVGQIRCTDKAIRRGVRGTPGVCFKKGLSVGYRVGMEKQMQEEKEAPDVDNMTLRELQVLARQLGISYDRKRKVQLIEDIKAAL